jgi:hypothetical protein
MLFICKRRVFYDSIPIIGLRVVVPNNNPTITPVEDGLCVFMLLIPYYPMITIILLPLFHN